MKKLFIHSILFRLLSPIFTGTTAYLLILLINNNISQLQEQFLGQELYMAVVLSYCVHEFSRFLLWVFKFTPQKTGTVLSLIFHIVLSILFSVLIVSVLISMYYQTSSGYLPSTEELLTFNSIYCSIPIAYVLLNLSHQYLYKINTQKLEHELLIKQNIEEDFKQFKREINPELLFQSFETLLSFIKEDTDKVDEFIDHLSTIYRYILANRKEQLISVIEEQKMLNELVVLYNQLPYRKVEIVNSIDKDFLIIPGALLFIVEQIIKTTIVSDKSFIEIEIAVQDDFFTISYFTEDKILEQFGTKNIGDIISVYSIYSKQKIAIETNDDKRTIAIPILKIKP
ncbi:MAG: histidine kinase [Flavobacteriaceae bacterium]|nr:histidine kinase [Flavobacteriaceae bacterium]